MLDPFYMIVDSSSWLERLLPCGLKLVQLRIKDKTEPELIDEIAKGKALCELYDCQLVVNDYWRIAIDLKCNYVHLGQEDLDIADLKAIADAGIKLGISTHNESELERALTCKPDYVALGPIYPTILKQMPFGPQGLAKLGDWRKRIGHLPLVGIGGLTVERGIEVLNSGADCVAAVTDITLNIDPELRVGEWLKATRKFIP